MIGVGLLSAIAIADTEDGFRAVRHAADCMIEMRSEEHPQGAAMRATCTWPDVRFESLDAMLTDYAGYSDFIFPVAESRVVSASTTRTLVYQRQEVFGISDREVLLWMQRHAQDPRHAVVSWTTANAQPLTLRRGSVRTPKNEGRWELRARSDGGVDVTHEIAVDAGGSIPKWVVRMVRHRAFSRVMKHVRERAASRTTL